MKSDIEELKNMFNPQEEVSANTAETETCTDIVPQEKMEVVTQGLEQDAVNDYGYVRENLYNLQERTLDAVEELNHIAKGSEHPRAYEVLANLIKTSVDINKQILDVQKDIRSINTKGGDNTTKNNIKEQNVQINVATTKDLLKMITKEINHEPK